MGMNVRLIPVLLLAQLLAVSLTTAAPSKPNSENDCVFSEDAIKKIQMWYTEIQGGKESIDSELICTVGNTASTIGRVAGTVAGYHIGRGFADKLMEVLPLPEFLQNAGSYLGGGLGALLFGSVGESLARFTLSHFLAGKSRNQVLSECFTLLQLEDDDDGRDEDAGASRAPPRLTVERVKRAYRRRALELHADKGGSQEQMVHLNLCKEIVTLHVQKRAANAKRATSKGEE